MSKTKRKVRFASMDRKALAHETAELDREFVADTFRPLRPASRKRWLAARRKPGRPAEGKGAQAISVTVERDLLRRCDALARALKISRARLIARGIRAVLAAEGQL